MRTRTSSLSRKLSIGLVVVLVTVILLLSGAGTYLFDRSLRDIMARDLQQDAEQVLHTMARTEQGIKPDTIGMDPSWNRPYSGRYYHVHVGRKGHIHEWRARALWDTTLPLPEHTGLDKELAAGPLGQRLLVWRADFRRFGTPIVIVVARDYSHIVNAFVQLGQLMAGVTGAGLLLLVLFQRMVVRRSLLPLEQIAAQIADIQTGKREQLDAPVPRELLPLRDEINRLLIHTRKVVNQNRHAVSDLGHSLKTPLAVLTSLAEDQAIRQTPELHGKIREQLQQIRARLERVLNRARMAQAVLPGDYFLPGEDLPVLCQALQQIHGNSRHLQWKTNNDRPLPLDRNDMLELIGNLLDNACKWASHHVTLELRTLPESVDIIVEDDGPGIPDAQISRITQRGERLDEDVAGHGLGLGIVSDTVAHYDGRLTFGRSQAGGLQVNVHLPLL